MLRETGLGRSRTRTGHACTRDYTRTHAHNRLADYIYIYRVRNDSTVVFLIFSARFILQVPGQDLALRLNLARFS